MYIVFISGESKLGNYLLAVANHYFFIRIQYSDEHLNINSFISMLKVIFQCESFNAKHQQQNFEVSINMDPIL